MKSVSLVAVLVLYRRAAEASESFVSLRSVLEANPALCDGLQLMIYDNSPNAQALPELQVQRSIRYVSNPANPGLATAYNAAAEWARELGAAWLLLLDQDTVLTQDFIEELRETLDEMPAEVWAVVPKLVHSRGVHSPHRPPRWAHKPLSAGFHGVAATEISAFNSGAAMRLSAVEALGGFPAQFPMEYLDHAMFHALQAAGGKVWVMRSELEHDLSTLKLGGAASLLRYRKVLLAERSFHEGLRWSDRAWYRLRRLRQSLGHFVKVKDKRFAFWDLRAAAGALGKEDNSSLQIDSKP